MVRQQALMESLSPNLLGFLDRSIKGRLNQSDKNLLVEALAGLLRASKSDVYALVHKAMHDRHPRGGRFGQRRRHARDRDTSPRLPQAAGASPEAT